MRLAYRLVWKKRDHFDTRVYAEVVLTFILRPKRKIASFVLVFKASSATGRHTGHNIKHILLLYILYATISTTVYTTICYYFYCCRCMQCPTQIPCNCVWDTNSMQSVSQNVCIVQKGFAHGLKNKFHVIMRGTQIPCNLSLRTCVYFERGSLTG